MKFSSMCISMHKFYIHYTQYNRAAHVHNLIAFVSFYRRKQNVEDLHETLEGFTSGNLLSPVSTRSKSTLIPVSIM